MIEPCEGCGVPVATHKTPCVAAVVCAACARERAEIARANANRAEFDRANALAITCDERASEAERLGSDALANQHRAEAERQRARARELKSKGTLL